MFLKVWLRLGLDIKHQDQYDEAWRDMSGHIPRVCFNTLNKAGSYPTMKGFVLLGWRESTILDTFLHLKFEVLIQHFKRHW